MEFFKLFRDVVRQDGARKTALLVVKAAGKALWQTTKSYGALVGMGIPLGVGITLGAAMVWNAAVRLASL